MNVILGAGLMGLLAREILGPDWHIIPQGRSRYFSTNPPLADNHIVFHKELVDLFKPFAGSTPRYFKKAVSYSGALVQEVPIWAKQPVIDHIFADKPHPLANELLDGGSMVFACEAKTVFDTLVARYHKELVDHTQAGRAIKIEGSSIITERGKFEFDKLVSTVPYHVLCGLLGEPASIIGRDIYVYDVETPSLDLEGAQQVYVADAAIPFYKVNVHPNMIYQFFAGDDLGDAYNVLGAFTQYRLQIRQAMCIKGGFPLGAPPDLSALSKRNIECVGSEAQWDCFMDISSSARRLLKLAGKL